MSEIYLEDCIHVIRTNDVNLEKSSFLQSSLAESSFKNVKLNNAIFENTSLENVQMMYVDLSGVSINQCKYDGMTINGISVEALIELYHRMNAETEVSSNEAQIEDLEKVAP